MRKILQSPEFNLAASSVGTAVVTALAFAGLGFVGVMLVGVFIALVAVRIDLGTRKITASIPTGRQPFGLALSPDRSLAFVANVGMYDYPSSLILPGKIMTACCCPGTPTVMIRKSPSMAINGRAALFPELEALARRRR